MVSVCYNAALADISNRTKVRGSAGLRLAASWGLFHGGFPFQLNCLDLLVWIYFKLLACLEFYWA